MTTEKLRDAIAGAIAEPFTAAEVRLTNGGSIDATMVLAGRILALPEMVAAMEAVEAARAYMAAHDANTDWPTFRDASRRLRASLAAVDEFEGLSS